MLRNIRPTTPNDTSEIADLLADVGLHSRMSEAEMRWKYWQERADWTGPRSFVVTHDAKIVAHAGIIPGKLLWDGGQLRTLHLIDWAARPDSIGAGVALMKYIGHLADALLAIGGSTQTLSIVPALGFRQAGAATVFMRPLHPVRILGGVQGPGWRLLPRTVRSAYWSAIAPSAAPANGRVRRIQADEIRALTREFPVPTDGLAVFERNKALFEHVLTCPVTTFELYSWERAEHARGYFLLAFAPAQARLADCWTESSDPIDWRSLALCAVREARRNSDAAELVAWASDPLFDGALRESGFHARGMQTIQLLTSGSSGIGVSSIRVQMLDNDAAYWHDGRAVLCA